MVNKIVIDLSKPPAEQISVVEMTPEEIAAGLPPPPTRDELTAGIIVERERRLSLGFDYNFGDARGIHRIGTTKTDMEGWDEVTKASQALCALGYDNSTISIVTDTGPGNYYCKRMAANTCGGGRISSTNLGGFVHITGNGSDSR